MPLRLVLRPGETLVINGAVLSAGDRAAILYLHNEATFLRGREVLREQDVDGPERALYFAIQERYLGSAPSDRVGEQLATLLQQRSELGPQLAEIAHLVREGRHYRALKAATRLFPSSNAEPTEPPEPGDRPRAAPLGAVRPPRATLRPTTRQPGE